MNNKTRLTIKHPKAFSGILDLALARATREPAIASKMALYAQELAESIGAIEIVEIKDIKQA